VDRALEETVDRDAAHGVGSTAPSAGTTAPEAALSKGAVLGRYIVIEELGHGAMGVVYKAYDPELDRKVALKVLRKVQAEGRARLVREGQAMAKLAHPNVAAVHDVGVYREQVFIAMELVEGQDLRVWMLAQHPWREVLATFVQAGRGLAAAHTAGIVHRDFKPDNALIGADGRVRVVDFGLAHTPGEGTPAPAAPAASAAGTSALPTSVSDSYTSGFARTVDSDATSGSLVGTPRYMPPEQLAGERVTPAADQFAFCASLWEALYGRPPFDGEDLLTLLSNVREAKIVDTPSRGVPSRVRQVLLRGMSPSVELRYPSLDALLAELQYDPTTVRWRWLAGAGAVGIALVAAVGARSLKAAPAPLCPSAAPEMEAVWSDAKRAQLSATFLATKKPFAQDAIRGASSALDAYGAAWVSMHGDACEASRVRGEQSSELMDLRMQCLEQRRGTMRALVDQLVVADAKGVQAAVKAVGELPPLADCADATALKTPVHPPSDPAVRARIETARDDIAQSFALRQMSHLREAADAADRAAAAAKDIGWAPLRAEALFAQSKIYIGKQDGKRAAATLEDAVLAAVEGRQETVEVDAWIGLVRAYAVALQWDSAHQSARHAHAALARTPDENREAILLREEGFTQWREGKETEARATLERALALAEKVLPPESTSIGVVCLFLANVLVDTGQYDDAIAMTRRALAIGEDNLGPLHPDLASSLQTMGNAMLDKGDPAGAEDAYQRGLDLRLPILGLENHATIESIECVGNARLHAGKLEGALENLQQAVTLSEKVSGPNDGELASKLVNLGEVYQALKRWDDAAAVQQRALGIVEKAYPPGAWFVAFPLEGLARSYAG
jgi:tetratricopeptide (TPR) repeat protein/predicted Ser/Thr protein kinase